MILAIRCEYESTFKTSIQYFLGTDSQMKQMLRKLLDLVWKGFLASLLTLVVYQFYYIEFIRSSVEDTAFDTINWFKLSKMKTDMDVSNLFVLLVDDYYLRSKQLLDDQNETRYGYILPRQYLSDIIKSIDALVDDIEVENYPKALFLDYDLSYLSDPNNKVMSVGDKALLEVLKKERPYTIYLPMTSHYNYIYHSDDKVIKKKIDSGALEFVSVGLTSAKDGISRRYFAYETYRDINNTKRKFPNVSIALWIMQNGLDRTRLETFSHDKRSLIENRIIFKDTHVLKSETYKEYQSNWMQLSAMSANYPLDLIYEESLKGAIIMVGSAHHASKDNFEIDAFYKAISGVEMHANALMSLNYLHGHLQRLPVVWSVLIVFVIVTLMDILINMLYDSRIYQSLLAYKRSESDHKKLKFLVMILPEKKEELNRALLVVSSILIMIIISYQLLISSSHYWFNWLIPAMMSAPYLLIMGFKKLLFR